MSDVDGVSAKRDVAISIVVPAYNAAKWIDETLRSVQEQGALGLQTIVVDDGSSDETAAIVAARHPWVTLIRTANRGVSAARTTGAQAALGRYLKFLDSDDLLVPGSLAAQLAVAERSGADVVYGDWQRLVLHEGSWQRGEVIERRWEDCAPDAELAFFGTMWCPTAGYLWRASFLRDVHPGWHEELPVIQDARFAQDAASVGARFEHLPGVAVLYRCHAEGSVSTRSKRAFWLDCERNTTELAASLRGRGQLGPAQHRALVDSWSQIARAAFPLDRALARRAWTQLHELDPDCIPSSNAFFRVLVKGLGPESAELVSALGRKWLGGLTARLLSVARGARSRRS